LNYHIYKDATGEWRWHLIASSGRIIADSAQGYESEQACIEDINRVKDSANAPVFRDNAGWNQQRWAERAGVEDALRLFFVASLGSVRY
jgi:uncharacterized protein YegP (UPF0339 family)